MKIVIIEDEKPAQDRLKNLIREYDKDVEILTVLDSVKASKLWFSKNIACDLIISDIQLADGDSFQIFDQVDIKTPIIFCTAYDEYALKAFKHNSIDYLLKPIDPKEFQSALDKYKGSQPKQDLDLSSLRDILSGNKKDYKQRFMVKVGERIRSIKIDDVSFFCSQEKATYLNHNDGKRYIIDYPLDEIEELIDPDQFFRLNRKYISHIDAIQEVFSYSNSRLKVLLESCDDNDILISREKVAKLKEWLDR